MPSMGGLAGASPPNVHIVGFGQTVNVFASKQRPKELTIYGSDFKWVPHNHRVTPSLVWKEALQSATPLLLGCLNAAAVAQVTSFA